MDIVESRNKDLSVIVNRTMTVDDPKAAAKRFIPGFAGAPVLMAVAFAVVLLRRRKKID